VRIWTAVLFLVTSCGGEFAAVETDAGMDAAVGGFGGADAGPSGGSGGTAPATPCHPSGLVDGFDGSVLNGLWTPQGDTQSISVSGGQLHFTPNPANPAWAGVVSAAYDLDECAVWTRVPVLYSNATTGFTYFQLVGASTTLAFEARGGNLETKDGSNQGSTSYDPVAHRWWRIRESGSTVYFEASPDGIVWKELQSVPSTAEIKSMKVGLGLVPGSAPTAPLETQFDDLDATP
jgi:hypothetical protein